MEIDVIVEAARFLGRSRYGSGSITITFLVAGRLGIEVVQDASNQACVELAREDVEQLKLLLLNNEIKPEAREKPNS